MAQQQQLQPPNNLQEQHKGSKHRPWLRWVILVIILMLTAVGVIIGIVKGSWLSIIPLLPILAIIIAVFQWLFPVSSSSGTPEHHLSSTIPQLAAASPTASIQPIIVHVPATQPLPPISPSQENPTYRGIIGFPPLTDSRTIQQREKLVREIYAQLLSPDITAIVLTGIGGVGKSTLAALIHRHAEEQRRLGNGPFTAEALWLRIDPAVTMTDLIG